MSGKSTLLRAIGANAVLAGAGAPVCATALSLPPVRVHTSMHVQDSPAEGVSLFMAELLRIKRIVDAAGAADSRGHPVLYLLDEILHGTNTAERQIAARGVLRHLLASGAIGAVSTHDLSLADAPDLALAAHAVHFREEVESRQDAQRGAMLTFDYELREGIATTRNALKLLDAVGLGALVEEEQMDPLRGPVRDAMQNPRVDLIYFEGCPHVAAARANLRTAIESVGAGPTWREWDAASEATPSELRRYGSPTVLVDGRDVTGGVGQAGGMACRTDGAPSVAVIAARLSGRVDT
jgi:hypothetical protein